MMARFAKERAKHHEKASLFNLGDDDDELTHLGQVSGHHRLPHLARASGSWQKTTSLMAMRMRMHKYLPLLCASCTLVAVLFRNGPARETRIDIGL